MARFGQDLYISQVSYIKGPISVLRVIAVGALVLISVISIISGWVVYDAVTSAPSALKLWDTIKQNSSLIKSFLCCTGPLGTVSILLLILLVVYSIYKFVTERDILVVLRAPPNEFQKDDIVSLEKAVNETVRLAVDRIGIELDLLSPDQAYHTRQRLF